MNRRTLLKALALLPVVGKLVPQKPDNPKYLRMKIESCPGSKHPFLIRYTMSQKNGQPEAHYFIGNKEGSREITQREFDKYFREHYTGVFTES